jgi:glycosyltransferase involved in cell wall biosynthesis
MPPKISLIVSVYKNIPALHLIFKALAFQSFQDFEVVVAEDNDGEDLQTFLIDAEPLYSFPIVHTRQADLGFRKCMALNAAIRMSRANYLVFIDGDCVPHIDFLKEHYSLRALGTACYGRRVLLSPTLTDSLYKNPNAVPNFSFINLILKGCSRLDCALYSTWIPSGRKGATTGIWGSNWSIHKSDLVEVNGFDEDYVQAGIGEDTDIEWRLVVNGVKLKYYKFRLIQYHLHHELNYLDTSEVEAVLKEKRKMGLVFCKNGLVRSVF